jgi:HlyD family secretion protein
MMRKVLLPLLAICGALLALFVVYLSMRKTPPPPIIFPPPQSPYPYAIAAAGIIEASSQNISIGCPFDEVIDKFFVIEGDCVKKGDLIFQLDLRAFVAAAEVAKAQLDAANVALENAKVQFSFYERLIDKRAVSEENYATAYYNFLEAEANVQIAQANLDQAVTNIERATIRAPIDGKILQVNAHVGEIAPVVPFISASSTWQTAANGTLVLMGTVNPLQVRIDIDEEDQWRYKPGARATAFVRGNSTFNFPVDFVRVEPYVIPKSSFTGETVERVDTRVLQVLYNFEKGDLPVYAGLLLDIFIESEPIENFIQHAKKTSSP